MSAQRTRPMDTLQNIISSFKKFEKKLDKLQDDVKYHGHTLSELRVMVANLSSGNMLNSEGKLEESKRLLNKTTTMQFDERQRFEEPLKKKRKNFMPTLSTEAITKSLDSGKNHANKIRSSPKSGTGCKRSLRAKKSEVPRKPLSSWQKDKPKKRMKNTQHL